jgi:phosphoesterase RecJ-like protein
MIDIYNSVAKILNEADNILITTHINPDGDGIGSGLALFLALEAMGKKVRFICPSPIDSTYKFLPGYSKITICEDIDKLSEVDAADTIISCDTDDIDRLGIVWNIPKKKFINIDHHNSNTYFGDINLVDEKASSTGVVIKNILDIMEVSINKEIAINIYTTIIYDTGRFMHSKTNSAVFRLAAELIDIGIDFAFINRKLTYSKTIQDLALQKLAIENLVQDKIDSRIAGITLTKEMVEKEVGVIDNIGDIREIPRSLESNEIAYILYETLDKEGNIICKLSLRSNPPYSILNTAKFFGGGGHKQAAGAIVKSSKDEIIEKLLPELRNVLQDK